MTAARRRAGALKFAAASVAACAVACAAGCASPGAPPGGPPDHEPPVILAVNPDSGAINVKAKDVTVRFNEVVSERPRAGNDLGALIVLSPSDGPARVDWGRTTLTVRPRKAFRPNTAYALTILPGIVDLSGNAIAKSRTSVFSTGTAIPRGVARGAVFDWLTLKPAAGALIDARVGDDTTFTWIARADSMGRYMLPFLPGGSYTIRAVIDANRNGRVEPLEMWDSATVAISDSARADLYAFTHDTLGARIVRADVKDSLTLRLTFDRPLALVPQLNPGQIEVHRADSSVVRVVRLAPAAAFDSLARVRDAAARDSAQKADTSVAAKRARARADSLRVLATRDSIENARVEARRAARDTVPRVAPPVPTRAALVSEFIAVLEQPLAPGTYRLTARQVVSASLKTATSQLTFTRAKPVEKKSDALIKGGAEKKPAGPARP